MKRKPPNMTGHPSPETWLLRALGTLEQETAKAVDRHARGCKACRGLWQAAQVVAVAARPGALEPVPGPVRRRAEAAFQPKAKRAPIAARIGFARLRLAAALTPFGWGGDALAAPGVRGATAARRCTLEGGDYRIDLEWIPEGGNWKLRGRLAGASQGAAPRLLLELGRGQPRRVRPGPRGFFGPVALRSPEVRLTLETAARSYRSTWVPSAPRARPTRRG